jgi:hypothetical protein
MKTIIDAVNELQANWSDNKDMKYLYFTAVWSFTDNKYTYRYNTPFTACEFMHTVSNMTCNFGKVTNLDLYDYINADKELLQPVKPDLIFTQEMCDNGELPSVGMLIENHGFKKIVIGELDTNNKLALKRIDNGLYSIAHIDDVKPLTPPIELIDGKAYQFENYQRKVMGIYCEEETVFHTHHGFHQASGCTNIQLLTVGDK